MKTIDTTPHKPRLEWLDALRGFTMIMVVANHVSGMAFEQPIKASSALPFLILFRMPLFFFISGFLAYKSGLTWNLSTLGSLLGKKFRVQTIPTIFFFLVAAVLLDGNFVENVVSWVQLNTKGGYWFTIVLLYMFIIYYIFCYIAAKLRLPMWLALTLLFLVSLFCYETCYLPLEFSWAMGRKVQNEFMLITSFQSLFIYMPFFLYGNIVRRYWDKAQRVMDSKWFFPIVVVVVFFAALDSQVWHTLRREWAIVPLTVARFGLLTIVFMYFRHYQQYFTQLTVMGSTLQYIGRRTLDIYLIHFLFMPNLPTIGKFLNIYRHNFMLDVTLSVVVALFIIGFCIITSNILRISPLFRKYLFGR